MIFLLFAKSISSFYFLIEAPSSLCAFVESLRPFCLLVNFLHAFPAHIDSSSMLFAFLQSTSLLARKFSFTDLQDLRNPRMISYQFDLWNLFLKKIRAQIFNSIRFFLDILFELIYVKNYTEQNKVARMLLFHCWNAFLVRRTLCTSLYVRRYFACSQNSSRRFARSQTLSCKILIIVCHVSRNSCKPFCFIVKASSHICGLVRSFGIFKKDFFEFVVFGSICTL